jgi:hypothetical protein
MNLPSAFYAEPRFRASSLDIPKLKKATKISRNTPGASLALAFDYCRTEAFATKSERDRACGPTAHDEVRYFPISRSALIRAGNTLDTIACDHGLDHPGFGQIFAPIFTAALHRQLEEVMRATDKMNGVIATTVLSIARVRYTIYVIRGNDWLNFYISGLSVFEEIEQGVMDRTIKYLEERLILELSPSLKNRRPN